MVEDNIVVFGGFGLSTDLSDPFKPSNPIDMWVSEDGANWELLRHDALECKRTGTNQV